MAGMMEKVTSWNRSRHCEMEVISEEEEEVKKKHEPRKKKKKKKKSHDKH